MVKGVTLSAQVVGTWTFNAEDLGFCVCVCKIELLVNRRFRI